MDKQPRTTVAALQSLWRKHDVADFIVRFVDLKSINALPVLSKSFAAGHLRLLCAAGTAKLVKRAIMDGLANSGRDVLRFRERWQSVARWAVLTTGDGVDPGFSVSLERGATAENHLILERTKPDLRTAFEDQFGLLSCVHGEHNVVKSLRMRCRFEPGYPLGGGDLTLRSKHGHTICRICFMPRPANGFRIPPNKVLGFWGEPPSGHHGGCVLKLSAKPAQWYTIEAKFDWEASLADVSVDGKRIGACRFGRFPFASVYLSHYAPFTSRFGDIEVEYYGTAPSRIDGRSPFAPDVDSGDSDESSDDD